MVINRFLENLREVDLFAKLVPVSIVPKFVLRLLAGRLVYKYSKYNWVAENEMTPSPPQMYQLRAS